MKLMVTRLIHAVCAENAMREWILSGLLISGLWSLSVFFGTVMLRFSP
jgi:hypothetical protein